MSTTNDWNAEREKDGSASREGCNLSYFRMIRAQLLESDVGSECRITDYKCGEAGTDSENAYQGLVKEAGDVYLNKRES